MQSIVDGIKRVTSVVGEISTASQEQTTGIAQVNDAINHLDQATHHNVSMVKEIASAVNSLNDKALELVQAVGVFKLPG